MTSFNDNPWDGWMDLSVASWIEDYIHGMMWVKFFSILFSLATDFIGVQAKSMSNVLSKYELENLIVMSTFIFF
jgi:hypothetical protein